MSAKAAGKKGRSRTTDVQSVTFDKQYWDARRAKSWLRKHGFKSPKVDETANQLRFRQRAPGQYNQYATKSISPTINLVLGVRSSAPKKKGGAAKRPGKPKAQKPKAGKPKAQKPKARRSAKPKAKRPARAK